MNGCFIGYMLTPPPKKKNHRQLILHSSCWEQEFNRIINSKSMLLSFLNVSSWPLCGTKQQTRWALGIILWG